MAIADRIYWHFHQIHGLKTSFGVILVITLGTATNPIIMSAVYIQPADAFIDSESNLRDDKAPPSITGDNVYVTWWTDKEMPNNNSEVMFRASTDGGATFSDKINLNNTTDTDSLDAEIDSDVDSVVVTWWERNQTANTPVMRVSNDNGVTFGPTLVLATNGTLGETAEEEE